MRSAEEIAALYKARSQTRGPLFARMRELRDTYNGDVIIPLPEISKHEQSTVANLVQQGLDQFARRVASVLPNLTYPALRPGIKVSEEKADKRRKVNYGWWEKTSIRKVQQRRSRWLLGYAEAPVLIRPDAKQQCPMWEPFSPLDTFPAPTRLDGIEPDDTILLHKRNLQWIQANYPEAAARVHKKRDCGPEELFDVLEYIDHDTISFVVLGHSKSDTWDRGPDASSMAVELTTKPNRAGICLLVNPGRVTLDRPAGHFDGILGMHQTQAALVAMEILAYRKTIFPDTWLVNPNTGVPPTIVQEPDYESGTPGIVTNGILDRQQIPPNFQAGQLANRLEGAQRDTAGLAPELGGMSQSNVRTARRGSQILGASMDFVIAEAQDAFVESHHAENVRAIEIDKAYFNFQKSFYVSTKGSRGQVDYKPSDLFEDKADHVVEYPMAGTDLSDLVINGGQRVAQETMSRRSFMEVDPLVTDVDEELKRIRFEALQRVFFMQIEQEGSLPDGPWESPDLARLAKMMFADDLDWWEAVDKLQKEKQKEQAEGAQPGAPETMPGLAMPGAGVEVPAVGEPAPSLQNMSSLLGNLGTTDVAMTAR